MVVERGVRFPVAPRVHVAVLTVVLGMAGVSVASLKAVGSLLKGAQISARPMVEENGVTGETGSVRNLQGGKAGSVLLAAACCKKAK